MSLYCVVLWFMVFGLLFCCFVDCCIWVFGLWCVVCGCCFVVVGFGFLLMDLCYGLWLWSLSFDLSALTPLFPTSFLFQVDALEVGGVAYVLEEDGAFEGRAEADSADWYNVVRVVADLGENYPLAAQWVSLWFPLGHIKSTKPNDQHFLSLFKESGKWLRAK